MKELTKAEEQVMQVLWKLERAPVKAMIDELPKLKSGTQPAYNTVSTIVRILAEKGFVGHEAKGRTHEYFPLISKEAYSNAFLNTFMGKYFGGSIRQMVSFFVERNEVSIEDIEALSDYLKEQPKSKEEGNDD